MSKQELNDSVKLHIEANPVSCSNWKDIYYSEDKWGKEWQPKWATFDNMFSDILKNPMFGGI